MRAIYAFCVRLLCFGLASTLFAQDRPRLIPKHYSVVSEND
jgi:hypothetical protein